MNHQQFGRRRFLHATAITAAWTSWGRAADAILTPPQTEGPYYPVPEIGQQRYSDTDLTRLGPDSPLAEGEIIRVAGTVVDVHGQPLSGSVVELWQASAAGRYNHPGDRGDAPLDPNFQYWGRVKVGEEGRYEFLTIRPGEYPGRTPHLHFRIDAPQQRRLTTQMYFADKGPQNERDGIYRRLERPQQEAVTIELGKTTDSPEVPVGEFPIVLGPREARGVTPDM
jgi:protocatechuate 3,4-dioxygenase, beta subunit